MATTLPAPPPSPAEPLLTLVASLALALLAYHLVSTLVPALGPDLVAKGLKGRDMLKPGFHRKGEEPTRGQGGEKVGQDEETEGVPGAVDLPEATGVIGASVYILLLSLFAPLPYLSSLLPSSFSPSSLLPSLNTTTSSTTTSSSSLVGAVVPADHPCATLVSTGLLEGSLSFPHHSFATYLASLLSLLIATFLGFCDDVFDIRWRFKLPIPLIASVPLLVTYAAGHGVTDIVLPNLFGLRALFGVEHVSGVLHLGPLYYAYMSLLSTFCTNSINILAGVNGVEVSQALLIALSLLLNDLLYLSFSLSPLLSLLPASLTSHLPLWMWEPISAGFANGSKELQDRHLFSLYFMLPLVGVCAGLLRWNWYPARSFIGDTFCYFSGMAFAVVGILGHFSKTLLLFFLPQVANFLYSTPQLFGLVPCPRHRLPRLDRETGRLRPSWAVIKPKNLRTMREEIGVALLLVLERLRLVQLERDASTREVTGCTNLTLLNLLLILGGPVREDGLAWRLIACQVAGSVVAFGVRYGLGGVVYGGGRV
ncbi:hypothetical protein JCM11251_007989 [Rhodosporidiobolus azoricus]